MFDLDADDGFERWSFGPGGPADSTHAVTDAAVYVGSEGRYLYVLDRTTGEERWRQELGGTVKSPTVHGRTVYVGAGENVYALDADAGSERWRFGTGDVVNASPAVAYDGV